MRPLSSSWPQLSNSLLSLPLSKMLREYILHLAHQLVNLRDNHDDNLIIQKFSKHMHWLIYFNTPSHAAQSRHTAALKLHNKTWIWSREHAGALLMRASCCLILQIALWEHQQAYLLRNNKVRTFDFLHVNWQKVPPSYLIIFLQNLGKCCNVQGPAKAMRIQLHV